MESIKPAWTVRQIFFAALVAGPIGGLYLMGKNACLFGEHKAEKKYWLSALGLSVALVIVFILLPEALVEKIPHFLPSLVCALALSEVARLWQGERIKSHLAEKKRHSYWRLVLHLLWLLPLSLAFIFVVGFMVSLVLP